MQAVFDTSMLLAQDEPNAAYLFWGAILFVAAFIIVGLELFVPSAGLLALMAGAALIASVVSFFMYDPVAGVIALVSYLILVPIILTYGFKWWLHSPLSRRFILNNSVEGTPAALAEDEGPTGEAPSAPAGRSSRDRAAGLRALIGATGEAVTPLRPVGTVRIEGRRIDALAESGAIDAGTPIVVTEVYDNQVKVRPR